jgi:transposase InsO family protein
VPRPCIQPTDRLFWSWLARAWSGWEDVLVLVQPRTVVAWQQKRFREHWRRLSQRGKPGRPVIAMELHDLIRTMSQANPTWKAFLHNHLRDFVSMDFFVVPTVTYKVLFVLVILAHERRRVLHVNVTEHPTEQWTVQQIVEAFPWNERPRYLLRDRDRIYGASFRQRARHMGIEEVLIAPRSPWQNPYSERLIGSLRREGLDHVIVLNERHLMHVLQTYLAYYHRWRTHLALDMDCPELRAVHSPEQGKMIAIPEVGGLHHHYERRAA